MSKSSIGPAPAERRVYAAWFEGLLVRALRPRLTPALRAELRNAGVDLEQPLAEHYPAAVRLECLRLLRIHLFDGKSDDQAWHELGLAAVGGFHLTLVGQAFSLIYRMLGPRSLMKRAGALLSSTNNYVSAFAVERGPFRWELRLEGADLPPAYYMGMVVAALEFCDASNPQVQLISQRGEQLVISCGWSPPVSRAGAERTQAR